MITRGVPRGKECKRGHDAWLYSNNPRRPYWRCGECRYDQEKTRRLKAAADKRAKQPPNSKRPGPHEWPEGYHHQPPTRVKVIPRGYSYNDQIREAVVNAMRRDPDLTAGEIAQRCGWKHSRKINGGDTTRIYRILGITLYLDKKAKGGFAYRQLIQEADAVALARAIHVDPWEVGL